MTWKNDVQQSGGKKELRKKTHRKTMPLKMIKKTCPNRKSAGHCPGQGTVRANWGLYTQSLNIANTQNKDNKPAWNSKESENISENKNPVLK